VHFGDKNIRQGDSLIDSWGTAWACAMGGAACAARIAAGMERVRKNWSERGRWIQLIYVRM